MATQGYIYFIQCNRFIKIGYSTTVQWRLRQYSTYNPFKLKPLGQMRGTWGLENRLHWQFKRYWVRGEWFRSVPSLRKFIRENTTPISIKPSGYRSPNGQWIECKRGRQWVVDVAERT